MTSQITLTALPLAPREYSQEYMGRLIKQIAISLGKITAVGPLTVGSDLTGEVAGYPVSGLTIINIPTATSEPVDLPDWSVWCDTTNNYNILKIKLPS